VQLRFGERAGAAQLLFGGEQGRRPGARGAGSETERGEGLRASGGGEFPVEKAVGALCVFLPGEAVGGNGVVLRGEVARGGGGHGSDGQEGALEGGCALFLRRAEAATAEAKDR
jgi:hypothetical protein